MFNFGRIAALSFSCVCFLARFSTAFIRFFADSDFRGRLTRIRSSGAAMREKYVRKLHVMLRNLIQLISILDLLEDKQIVLLFNSRVLIPPLASRSVS